MEHAIRDRQRWNLLEAHARAVCEARTPREDSGAHIMPGGIGRPRVRWENKRAGRSSRPIEVSMHKGSPLPDHAQNANPARLVKLLCKGDCSGVRWAEMNADYPGQDVLSKSQLGDFTAVCLRCGKTAKDSYNWFR